MTPPEKAVQDCAESPPPAELDRDAVLAQLDRILASPLFQHSRRYPALLRHVVQKALEGATDELKERSLGIVVFKRAAEYDTSADPVVRNTASEVRKRLDEYYADTGHALELRIALPVGAYVPKFRPPPAETRDEPVQTLSPPLLRPSRRWIWIAADVVVCVGAIAAGIQLTTRKPAIERFWQPILNTNDSVLVVTETLMALSRPQTITGNSQVTETIDPKLFLNVQEVSAKLGSFLRGFGKTAEIELARNVTVPRLRRGPFILLGAFNNPLTRRSVSSYRFYLDLDREHLIRRIADRQNPLRKDWAAPMQPGLTEDFALIARAPDPDTGQTMLAIAGLGERGSAAAMEFVTNPKYLAELDALSKGWDRRRIELVIQTKLVNEDWGEPRLVASHFW